MTPGPRTCMTQRSVTTPSAERSLLRCSLRSEENQRAVDKLITLLKKVFCQVSQSLFVGHARTGRPVDEFSPSSSVRENPCRDSENEQIRILLERQKEQILADCRAEIQKHEFQADHDRRSIQKLNGVIESQRGGEINRAHQGDERLDEINNFFMNNYWNKNRELREAHVKSLNEMEELKRFQGSTFDTFLRRK